MERGVSDQGAGRIPGGSNRKIVYLVIAVAVVILATVLIAKFGFSTDLVNPEIGQMSLVHRYAIATQTPAAVQNVQVQTIGVRTGGQGITGSSGSSSQSQSIGSRVQSLQSQIAELNKELEQLQEDAKNLQARIQDLDADKPVISSGSSPAEISAYDNYLARRDDLQSQLDAIYQKIQQLQNQIDALQAQLAQLT